MSKEAFLTDQGYLAFKERTFSYNEKRSVYPLFMHNKGRDMHILALDYAFYFLFDSIHSHC
ncbi:hypothetical protein F3B51_20275 [Bacteroides ovatus]|uniref:Uncharacterized protein n=1 Tax=Bacteroides ovatus TaxID=28116 RepID=A0A414E7W8_BACOV|nr:hypothetical protein BSCG_00594 [Bacteroides sp. 2_2_4]EFI36489.1 hypothetical protein HMPREF9010_04540 [Bacteroides sp. 3_1_23]KAA3924152.1 hypothetical protein F3D70_09595 [Bacteroides ovatus]RJX14665.1 hypothetical protein DXA54_02070 [Bacteroides sp. OF03-11BH]KAA3929242.1 hypothetical protein F3F25_09155 [Bacteroides ovatus]